MYRRIEFIYERNTLEGPYRHKGGIMSAPVLLVLDAWCHMNCPRRKLRKNTRFFFTELGWDTYGRPTIRAAKAAGVQYIVKKIKESSVDCFYKDEYQVAVRPRKLK